ncbi:hypothetical protein EON65_52890 [archaeon]|nr:MAG: hypothetical protein EON65_52890 [archaeon]
MNFPSFTTDKVKDMLSYLWKHHFYKPIEEYRNKIKERKKLLDMQRNAMGHADPKDRAELMGLTEEFVRFLNDSTRYFAKLMTEVCLNIY